MHAVLRKHTDIAVMLLETPHVDVNMQDKVCVCVCACVCACVRVFECTCPYVCV